MPRKRRVVVPKDKELFIPVFKPGDRFYRKNLGELIETTASNRCIYFNKRTGNDDKDGLTYENAVKTERRLIELLREHEFDTIYCTKSVYNTEGDDDDASTSEIVIDLSVLYKWTRLIITGDGYAIRVNFDEVPNVPAPDPGSLIQGNIRDVFIVTKARVYVTGKMKSKVSYYGVNLNIFQTGHGGSYKGEGVQFESFYIEGTNYIDQGRDLSLERTNIHVESVGDVTGSFSINYGAEQGYDPLRDRIGTIYVKSDKVVEFGTSSDSNCDDLIIDCKGCRRLHYSLYAINSISIHATDFINVYNYYVGSDKNCGTLSLNGGSSNEIECYLNNSYKGKPIIVLGSIYGQYIDSLGDIAYPCSPKVNIDWNGEITFNGSIHASSYNEYSKGHVSMYGPMNLYVNIYAGYDQNDNLIFGSDVGNAVNIKNEGRVNIEQLCTCTKSAYEYIPVNIDCDAFSPNSSCTIMSQYITIKAKNLVCSSYSGFRPGVTYYSNGNPSWNYNFDYQAGVYLNVDENTVLNIGNNYGYNQEFIINSKLVYFLSSIEARTLRIKADQLQTNSQMYLAEVDIDVNTFSTTSSISLYNDYYSSGGMGTSVFQWRDYNSNSKLNIKCLQFVDGYNSTTNGLIHTNSYVDNRISPLRNIDININTIVCSINWSSDKCCPILGYCSALNGVISGEIGCIVNNYGGTPHKVSRWTKDLIFYDSNTTDLIGSLNWAPNSRVSLHFSEYNGPCDFYMDPDQGDDRYDGLTEKTPIRTVNGLYRVLKQLDYLNYSNASTSYYIVVNPFIALHMLSGSESSNRGTGNQISFLVDSTTLKDDSFSGTCELWFNNIEIIPEAPNLSTNLIYLHSFAMIIIRGFYQISLYSIHANGGIYVDAENYIGINNSSNSPAWNYYNEYAPGSSTPQRSAMLILNAYDISISGMFLNARITAENSINVHDTYGSSPWRELNCCLTGYSVLKAGYEIYLGESGSFVGLSGRVIVESGGYLRTYIDTLMGDIELNSELNSYHYSIGYGYMNCRLNLESNDSITFNTNSGYASCFNGTSTYGEGSTYPGSYITMFAKNQINGSFSSFFRCDLRIKSSMLSTSSFTLYGDRSKAFFDVDELYSSISYYNYSYISIRSRHSTSQLSKMSGGPISESSLWSYVFLDVDVMRSSISLPVYEASYGNNTELNARIGTCNSTAIIWNNGDPTGSDASTIYTLNVTINNSRYNGSDPDYKYTNYGKNAVPANSTGEILILNDRKNLVAGRGIAIEEVNEEVRIKTVPDSPDVVTKQLTVDNNSAEVEIDNDKYNVIQTVSANITDLNIKIQPSQNRLQECGFEFDLEDHPSLRTITAKMRGRLLPMIAPSSFTAGKIYQGTSVHGLVTIAEFEKVIIEVTNVEATNLTSSSVDIEVTGTGIENDLEYVLEFDLNGTTYPVNAIGPVNTLTGNDFTAYNNASSVTVTPVINDEDYGTYILKQDPYNPLGLPDRTIRIQVSSSSIDPSTIFTYNSGVTFTRVSGTQDQWDVYYDSADWFSLFRIEYGASSTYKNALIKVLGANTTTVTDMHYMFYGGNTALTEVALFDTSNVTNMSSMFYECSSLTTVPDFDTSNVTDMSYMFEATAVATAPNFNTSNVTNMWGMFKESRITTVPNFDTSSVTQMDFMFEQANNLTNITLQQNFVFTANPSVSRMFAYCYNVDTGILSTYQKMSAANLTSHSGTFNACGTNTSSGQSELAQVPSDWK